MAAKLEGGAYLSSFVDSISEKLSSLIEHDSVLDSTLELLQRLDDCLCDVGPVLDDAELKQLSDKRVKKWLVDLQDALYMADDLVDELSTKAATDQGKSNIGSRLVDSLSGANDIEKIVGTIESIVGRKDKLRLKESAKLDTSWRIPSTSLVVSSDIFGRDQDKENIIKLLLEDTSCDVELPVTGIYISSFVDAISKKLCSVPEGNDHALKLLFRRLDDCLLDVEPVLHDAELKQFHNERVKMWLVDLRGALRSADNFLDELSTKAATAPPQDPGNSYWSRTVDSIIYGSSVDDMEKIVGTLEDHVGRKDRLRLKESAELEDVSSDKLLSDDTCDAESPVTVIPIVGMGGIGKTTLAQLIYNDVKVVAKFKTRAWVCVAENPDLINVTKTIIGAIDFSPCHLDNFESLQKKLKQKLSRKTFLVVLDDVWDDRRDAWEEFLKPFQYGNNGSKILLTTRNEKVASAFTSNNLHYRLSLLSKEDCWSLFLKHSSISANSKKYATLEPFGRKIVEKCKGLPLAVKTLGGLLRNNSNEGDWENILESEIWELSEDKSKIVPALGVSYHYLPSHLKRCFVYCSLFPEDYQFDKNKLILLWMADDLLQPKQKITLEDIGCAYFDELVARSFFQPSSNNGELFVMHDLMRDLAMFLAGKFYFKLKEFGNRHLMDNKTRHLSCATKYDDTIKFFREAYNGAAHMRTFLDFTDNTYHQHPNAIKSGSWLRQQQLGCLRVFSSDLFQRLPNSIAESIHLRYLDLSYSPIEILSESICKLYNLQTLKLRDCKFLKMLPERLQDLVNLRHLDIRGAYYLREMPKGMSKLLYLNFLSDYIVGKEEDNGIRELGRLDDLHGSFCISRLEKVKNSGEASEARMGNKKHINTLELEWYSNGDIDDIQIERDILDELQPHENLKELSIEGYRGETFPDWLGLSAYSNMTKLTLNDCKNCRELPALGPLPSLQHLKISRLKKLEKIDFVFLNKSSGSFQQETPFKSLEKLEFYDLPRWREWHFPQEFDGFHELRILSIKDCPVFRGDLPAHLPALEELTFEECEELACSLPRAPKLCQLFVKGGHYNYAKPQSVVISESRLAMSTLECLSHIQSPGVQFMKILGCPALTISEQLQHKWLTEIEVDSCHSLRSFPLGDLSNLEKLQLSNCRNMKCVEASRVLPSLLYLDISFCESVVSLPVLGRVAPRLEDLQIRGCPEIVCSAEECLPQSLKILQVSGKLASWIASKDLQIEGLTHLQLMFCDDVKSFPIEGCPLPASLEHLLLWSFPDLETLDCKGLQHLTSLNDLTISRCYKLENIIQQHLLASIQNIHIGFGCPLSTKLKEMENVFVDYYDNNAYDDDDEEEEEDNDDDDTTTNDSGLTAFNVQ